MKSTITLLIAAFFTATSFSQETTPLQNTVDSQFRTLYKNSNSWQEYKVVKKSAYRLLHTNVLDSVKNFNTQIKNKNTLIKSQKSTIDTLEKNNKETNTKLTTAISKANSIGLFGIQLAKGTYSLILLGIILLLIAALSLFIYKFKNSSVLTTEAKSNLEDIENEYKLSRKKSLEREQKLRRELQDERNKNNGN
jgi:biopolymer transport protein ExbB/TolQ